MMRKTITVAAAALLALPLAACGDDGDPAGAGTGTGSGDAAKPITYGIPSPLASEPGEHNINLGITCYAEKTGGRVITLDANLDVNKQISDFDNLLAQGAKALVIGGPPIPAVTERIGGFKDNAAEAKITVLEQADNLKDNVNDARAL